MATCPTCRTHYADDVERCPTDGASLLVDQAFASADAPLVPGSKVGEYEVEGVIGEGGFGTVYKAMHPVIGKAAAVKLLKREFSSNPEMVSRFISEARAVNQIRHKNIIDIFSFGALADGRQFFVMELLEGMVLDRYLEQSGRLSPSQAVTILKPLARALGAAHAAGIAHRDIKPENVFLTFDDEGRPQPKLLDFGIAKLAKDAGTHHKTQTGTPLGTPLYMSPEQVHGRAIDQRTDIYSLGVVAFELLTGELPFNGTSVMDIMMKQAGTAPPIPSSVASGLPTALDAPILKMLEKDPAKRPESVVAAIEGLERAVAGAGLATSANLTPIAALPAASQVVIGSDVNITGDTTVAAPSAAASTSAVLVPSVVAPIPRGSQATLFLGVGVAAVAAIAAGAYFMNHGKTPSSEPNTANTTRVIVAVATVQASSIITPAPIVAPASATASAAPTITADVTVKVASTPPAADVFRDNEKIGTTDQPFKLPRGSGKVKLSIRKASYVPAGDRSHTVIDDVSPPPT